MIAIETHSKPYKLDGRSTPEEINLWGASVSLLDPTIDIEDIYVLRHDFPFYEYLYVSNNNISIENAVSRLHLHTICQHFTAYLHVLMLLKSIYKYKALYWTEDDIKAWQYLAETKIEVENI